LLYEAFRSSRTRALVAPGYVFAAAWIALLGLWQFKRLSDGGAVVILGLIILSAACNADWLSRLLSHRVWRQMGDISYSLYLVHLPLILAFWIVRHLLVAPDPQAMSPMGYRFTKPEGLAGLAALYIAAIGAATLTYRFVEQPARRWLRTVL